MESKNAVTNMMITPLMPGFPDWTVYAIGAWLIGLSLAVAWIWWKE